MTSSGKGGTRILSSKEYDKLHRLYTTFSKKNTASFGSIASLVKTSKLPRAKVLAYLYSSPEYTMLKTPKRSFPRLIAVSPTIDGIWSMDLAYVDKLAHHNDGVTYLIVGVDVLSRFLRVEPLADKKASTAKKALEIMIKGNKGRPPGKIWVDQGTEFMGVFGEFCRKNSIVVYSTHSETKSALAERYIRTLKNIIYRYIEYLSRKHASGGYNLRATRGGGKKINEGLRYIDKLQCIVNVINGRFNKAIKMAPGAVTPDNVEYLLKRQEEREEKNVEAGKTAKPVYKVGDVVRVAKENLPFRKGYKPQYTEKLYSVRSVVRGAHPITYALKTHHDEEKVLGKFYKEELTRFTPDE
jgi:hypothetical protein